MQEKNERLKEKIEKQEQKENEQKNMLKNLDEEIQLKEKSIETQKRNQDKIKGQISELKKLVEKTFLELDDFSKMDETLLTMIKDSS